MSEQVKASTAVLVRIEGRVQGVGFRYFVYRNAKSKNLTGWVRNLDDGSVQARFEGSKEDVDYIIKMCNQGPVGSSVKDVQVEVTQPEGKYTDFNFRYE